MKFNFESKREQWRFTGRAEGESEDGKLSRGTGFEVRVKEEEADLISRWGVFPINWLSKILC